MRWHRFIYSELFFSFIIVNNKLWFSVLYVGWILVFKIHNIRFQTLTAKTLSVKHDFPKHNSNYVKKVNFQEWNVLQAITDNNFRAKTNRTVNVCKYNTTHKKCDSSVTFLHLLWMWFSNEIMSLRKVLFLTRTACCKIAKLQSNNFVRHNIWLLSANAPKFYSTKNIG